MEDSILTALIPILMAIIGDGIEMFYRTKKSNSNKKIIDKFRSDLRKFPVEKGNFGIAIPCYKNPQDLAACLDNLINWVGISPEDIVVVDDYSNDDDETINEARKYGVNISKLTKYEKDVRKIRAQKKAAEILCKKGKDYIIALDSDSFIRVKKEYFNYCVKEMEILGLDVLAGRIMPMLNNESTLFERIQFADYLSAMRAGRGSMYRLCINNQEVRSIEDLKKKYILERSDILCVSGAFGIFKTELFLEVLNECKILCAGEDYEITLRALAKGAKIGYDDDLLIETKVPRTIREFTRQRDFWARFVSSHYINAPYLKQIYKRNRNIRAISLETVETSLALRTIKDVFAHPVKLVSIIFLVTQPLSLILFLCIYELLNLININTLRINEENSDWIADLLSPFLAIYILILPTTLGYFKHLYMGIRKNWREKIEEIKTLEKELYLEFKDFSLEKIQNTTAYQKEDLITKVNKGIIDLIRLSKLKNITYPEFYELNDKMEKAKFLLEELF